MWWNWQTRGTQNPVMVTSCGFDPHHRHHLREKVWCKNQAFFFYRKQLSLVFSTQHTPELYYGNFSQVNRRFKKNVQSKIFRLRIRTKIIRERCRICFRKRNREISPLMQDQIRGKNSPPRRTDKMLQRGDRSRLPVIRFAVWRKKFTLCDSRRIFRFPLFGRNDDRKTANRKNGYRSSFFIR